MPSIIRQFLSLIFLTALATTHVSAKSFAFDLFRQIPGIPGGKISSFTLVTTGVVTVRDEAVQPNAFIPFDSPDFVRIEVNIATPVRAYNIVFPGTEWRWTLADRDDLTQGLSFDENARPLRFDIPELAAGNAGRFRAPRPGCQNNCGAPANFILADGDRFNSVVLLETVRIGTVDRSVGDIVPESIVPAGIDFTPLNGLWRFGAPSGDSTPDFGGVLTFNHEVREPICVPRTDTDGDSLYDEWEEVGIDVDCDGIVDLDLPALGAKPEHKDIFVEVDWMENHKPHDAAIGAVQQSFRISPVTNPDGRSGIDLNVIINEEIPHENEITFDPSRKENGIVDFSSIKEIYFGTAEERLNPKAIEAKRLAFRYGLFAHSLHKITASGQGELPGNDFVITLGGYKYVFLGHVSGNASQQAGTFMHELGHTLNFRHGGNDDLNCKPNYLSVMSYSRQSDGAPIIGRTLDYSRDQLETLDELKLNETIGINGPLNEKTSFRVDKNDDGVITDDEIIVTSTIGPIDWNQDGDFGQDSMVKEDINCDIRIDNNGAQVPIVRVNFDDLFGFNDWDKLLYDLRQTIGFADGAQLSSEDTTEIARNEMTREFLESMSPDSDSDGTTNIYDNCMVIPNPNQNDTDQDTVGDACDNCPETVNPGQEDDDGNGVGNVCEDMRGIVGDFDADGDIDRNDLDILLAARNTPASGANDPRDLDGSGMITVLDARKLALLCTRPGCATE